MEKEVEEKKKEEVKEKKENVWLPDLRVVPKESPLKREEVLVNTETGATLTIIEALASIKNDLELLKKVL